jgi:hypothetical protein
MTNKPLKSLNQDASLADIGKQLWQLWQLMKVHWRPMVIYPLLFGLVGLGVGLVLHTDKKKAEFIIAAEEQGASGMDGLLAQFGLDIGSSNPGGVFEGESLVRLFQIRSLVERSLLTTVDYQGKPTLLADLVWKDMNASKKSVFNGVKFSADRSKHSSLTDSALFLAYRYVNNEVLSVSRPDKKQSFVTVSCAHRDPDVAMLLSETMIETVTEYYIETLTKKARYNLNVLRLEADSVQKVLNRNLQTNASMSDLNLNPLMQRARVGQNRSMIDLQISISLYGELIKNLKLAEIGLRKQTPLIQIIERPHYPLEHVGLRWWQYVLGGLGLGLALALYLVYLGWLKSRAEVLA